MKEVNATYFGTALSVNNMFFDFYLIGTLACLRSNLDYILEDYSLMFFGRIRSDMQLNKESKFEKLAKKEKNEDAISFIDFYKKEKRRLFEDKIVKDIFNARNITLHDRRLARWEITNMEECFVKKEDGSIEFQPEKTKMKKYFSKDLQFQKEGDQVNPIIQSDQPDIIEQCEHCLKTLEEFSNTISERFPLQVKV